MFGFGQLIEVLKKSPKKIVFTEGSDPRILEASSRLLASNFLHPILVGDPDEIEKAAEESGFNIRGFSVRNLSAAPPAPKAATPFCIRPHG